MAWMIASDENLEYLQHYGTPGMKWGVRNYIDENGTLTAAGRERYNKKSTKYTQSAGLASRKKNIEYLRERANSMDAKTQKEERKAVRKKLKEALASYRQDAKTERANYTAQNRLERAQLNQERENLKEVNRYTQYNKRMANSIERTNRFTELVGNYNKKKASEIQAKKTDMENKSKALKAENERVANMDIREATNSDNVARFQKAMKNFRKGRR